MKPQLTDAEHRLLEAARREFTYDHHTQAYSYPDASEADINALLRTGLLFYKTRKHYVLFFASPTGLEYLDTHNRRVSK